MRDGDMIKLGETLFASASWFISSKRLEKKYPHPTVGQRGAITSQRNRSRRITLHAGLDHEMIDRLFEKIWQAASDEARLQ